MLPDHVDLDLQFLQNHLVVFESINVYLFTKSTPLGWVGATERVGKFVGTPMPIRKGKLSGWERRDSPTALCDVV